MSAPFIRRAQTGDEKQIHQAHMRSINEVCIKDHGPEEVKGWGNRPLGERWKESILKDHVWVIEHDAKIYGLGYLRVLTESEKKHAYFNALYLTPEVLGLGLGLQLANLMVQTAKDAGAEKITLESSLTAHGFYLGLGFKDTGPLAKQDVAGFAVSYFPMSLSLSTGA